MRSSFKRTLLGMATTLAMSGFLLPGMHAQADGASLVISEINWAGSQASPSDQWIELYNATSSLVNFDVTPYHLMVNGVDQVDLMSGAMLPHSHYLVSRLTAGSAASDLQVMPDKVVPGLSLPTSNASYQLTDQNGTVVDKADDGSGVPLAGSLGNGAQLPASMERVSVLSDGTTAGAWMTASTMGAGLKANAEYATPESGISLTGALNPSIALPSAMTVSPAMPTPASTPVVQGTALATSGQTQPISATVAYGLIGGSLQTQTAFVSAADGSFTANLPMLPAGVYRILVNVEDVSGNQSGFLPVQISGSPQNAYVVNAAAATVATPTLDSYPAITSQSALALTGSVQAGTSLVFSINGQQVSQEALPATQTTFSLPVSLLANTVNTIEVRARDAAGNVSAPAVATITQDSLAPILVTSSVSLQANQPGSLDTVSGAAGATEAGVGIYVYADAGLTQQISMTTANADGSFGPLGIGDNQYPTVYVVARDAAGNMSPSIQLVNAIAFGSSNAPVQFSFSNVGTIQATLTIQSVPGAVGYRLKYKQAGGTYSSVIDFCSSTAPCELSRVVQPLLPNTSYVFAVAAVDQFGNQSGFTEQSVTTQAAVIGKGSAAGTVTTQGSATQPTSATSTGSTSSSSSTSMSSGSTSTATPTPAVSPSPSPTASPEAGQVKSAEDNGSTTRNYTPWIILAILLALAILATTGYFYWFGGEAGEAVDAAPTTRVVEPTETKTTTSTTTPPVEKPTTTTQDSTKRPNDREKRW